MSFCTTNQATTSVTDAAVVYARIAMELCGQERGPMMSLGAHPDRHIAASVAAPRAKGDGKRAG